MAEANSPRLMAKKTSWGTLKDFMSGQSTILPTPLNITLTKEQVEFAVRGFIPKEMEDHWFIYFDPDDGMEIM